MFCPRCGTPNTETIKFCRQCGLALQQVSGYVSSGGTGTLQPPPQAATPLARATEGLSPMQRMILAILLWAFSPAIFKVLGDATGLDPLFDGLAKLVAVLMAPGIIFTVFYFRGQIKRQKAAMMAPAYYQQIPPPPTNRISQSGRGSVTEDETRRFQG